MTQWIEHNWTPPPTPLQELTLIDLFALVRNWYADHSDDMGECADCGGVTSGNVCLGCVSDELRLRYGSRSFCILRHAEQAAQLKV